MTDALSVFLADLWPLVGFTQEALLAGFIVFLRVGAAMAALPAFGEQHLPARVRLAAALAFTFIVAPAVTAQVAPLAAPGRVLGLFLLTETAAGLALGLMLRLFVLALQTAGAIIAQTISLSQLFGGASPEPQPVVANILTVAALALAAAMGLHVRLAEYLILSYDMLPAGRLPEAREMAAWGLGWVRSSFALSFTLAAPFVIGSALYNVAIGAINRAMPALMVSFIGAPAQVLGGIAMLAVLLPVMLALWWEAFAHALTLPALP